ncbi:MAG: class I SAM-dependent methyltransferase [Candidatus Zixiibacteriota bacterium]
MNFSPYSYPELYELAFNFRDYQKAVDFILQAVKATGISSITSMVELGCGPAQYAREFSRRNIESFGVDNSQEMIKYAQKLIEDEKLSSKIIDADFCRFQLPKSVDLAICMMATFNHLLTNNDILTHLNCVADNLKSEGMYLIELPHPRDIFTVDKSCQNVWEVKNDDIQLAIDWGSDAVFDPMTEIDLMKITFTATMQDKTNIYTAQDKSRRIGLGLLRALIELSDRFRITGMYGDLDINQPFDNTKKSWRLILVLRKYE